MIRIQKSSVPPEKLFQDGKKKRRSHCLSYTRDPAAYQSGEKKFSFDSNIYAHPSVKQALIEAQHKKCCFCERLIGTNGDVEHFRPKQAFKQASGKPLQRPGYYWLAYEWDNLYLSCPACNQRHKQNLFPLQNPDQRASNHRQSTDSEQPLFIDPGKEEPEAFIRFRGEFAYPVGDNQKGRATLESLKLNDNGRSLPEARLQRLQLLKQLWQLVQKSSQNPDNLELQELSKDAAQLLKKATQADAEFSAAVRWAIETQFEFIIG